MAKQKNINAITFETGNTIKLAKKAQQARDDEFFTNVNDIKKELEHYKDYFYEADIICPCDWFVEDNDNIHSLTIEFYDEAQPHLLNLHCTINSVKCKPTYYKNNLFSNDLAPSDKFDIKNITVKEAEDLIASNISSSFARYLCSIAIECGIHSVTISGYNPFTNRGIKFQDVDYSKYNLCITNPPFTQFSTFINILISEHDARIISSKFNNDEKDIFNFIILAPYLNRVTPNVGLNLMLEKCYLGFNRKARLNFLNPIKDDLKHSKSVACDWVTSYRDAQDEIDNTNISTGIDWELFKDRYSELENITMQDGTHPIKINNINAIPDNYNGWMFASIGLLDILPTNKFEWYGTNFKGYYNKKNPKVNPFAHKCTNEMMYNEDNNGFHGIVFRRK